MKPTQSCPSSGQDLPFSTVAVTGAAQRLVRAAQRIATSGGAAALTAAAVWAAMMAASPAQAVEVTDVLDAFDDQNDDAFDGSVRLRFVSETRKSVIARQQSCLKNDVLGTNCPSGNSYVLARELEFERVRNTLNVDVRIGLYKDFELYAVIPVVVGDDWKHEFAAGVSSANSTILPPSAKEALFKVPYQSTSRSGLGDLQLGLKWAPFNYFRDAGDPTWIFGLEYTAPTGTAMQASNTGVGYGLHDLTLYSTMSRRALQVLEPFINVHVSPLRSGADSGLFVAHGQTQKAVTPGFTAGANFGLTVVPWENLKKEERLEVEAGFGMDYMGRGREYTEIWEALASPNNPCKPSEGCSTGIHDRSEVDPATGKPRRTDGITEVESYARFNGWAAVHFQPIQYFQLSAKVGWMTETPHYITFGEVGKDLDGNANVQQFNKNGQNEYSPVFLWSVDQPGQRLRATDISGMTLMFSASGKF